MDEFQFFLMCVSDCFKILTYEQYSPKDPGDDSQVDL